MTDREAFRFMLVYAQREADMLDLPSVAQALSQAIAEIDAAPPAARGAASSRCERLICADVAVEAELHGHFEIRRLQ